jgi:hypothetical protein
MTIDPEIFAREAARLQGDIFLQEVIRRISMQAMDDLVRAKPDDVNEIITQQMRVKFCSDLWAELKKTTNSGQAKKPKTVV